MQMSDEIVINALVLALVLSLILIFSIIKDSNDDIAYLDNTITTLQEDNDSLKIVVENIFKAFTVQNNKVLYYENGGSDGNINKIGE